MSRWDVLVRQNRNDLLETKHDVLLLSHVRRTNSRPNREYESLVFVTAVLSRRADQYRSAWLEWPKDRLELEPNLRLHRAHRLRPVHGAEAGVGRLETSRY